MTSTRSFLRRVLIVLTFGVAALAGFAYGLTTVLRVRPPHLLLRLLFLPPSSWENEFPRRPVPAAGPVRPLPKAVGVELPGTVPWEAPGTPIREMLRFTKSQAFVVLHDGHLVHEWYADDIDGDSRLPAWSLTKAVVSLLVGQAIDRGQLSEDDRLVDLLPELRTGDDFDEITVRDLLDMSSGIDIVEEYNPWWPFTGVPRLMLSTDLPGYLRAHRELRFTPGSQGEYRSVDTQMLGFILARVDGRPLARILSEELWTPMGAEADATWNLDRKGGVEKAFCCLNAVTRDLARIGQLVLDRGRVREVQVVPEAWIERIFTPSGLPVNGWGYSAHWWHPSTGGGDVLAFGVFGQYIYVDPDSRTVIVHLGYRIEEQDEALTPRAVRAIAAHLKRQS